VEYRIFDRNGDLHWHLTDLIPRFNDQGEVESYFGYSFDLTEKKLHEDRLNEAREAAEKASQVKSDFLALVSHEIRTPLNALVGFSGLARRTSDDDQLRQYIEILDQSAHLLMDLVNDVLDMSRVEAGQLRIKDAPFNLVEVLELLRWQFTPLVDKNAGVTMRLELGPELPAWVVGDATRLRQVLSNLLANALKFTDDGSVVLRVQGERSTAKDDYFWLRLEVEDTGIGIDLSKQDLLFEPFQQIDPGISRSYGGTGLGLAIVQRLVTLMGGSIEVQSQLGQGSCFTVRVPVRICAPVVLEQECGGLSSSLLVLVVEDNGFNRLLLEKTLREWGHRVITVENGEEALKRVEERLFDCIILDLWMPNLNGLELAGRLRSRERALKQGQTPIIAYTADTDERTRERALQAGMQEVLCKPLDLQKLCVVLRTYCTGARAKTGESGASEQKNKSDQELQSFGLDAKVMVDMGSDQARIVTYAHLLWEDIEAEKNKLDQAFLLSNREQILEAAHSLKGLCGYLADGQAGELALRLHQGADELPLCALNSLVQKLYSHLKPPAFVNEKRET